MGSLFTSPKARFLVALGHQQKDRSSHRLCLLRSFLPFTSPFALVQASLNLVVATLLVFLPSRDQTAQTSQPLTRLNPLRIQTLAISRRILQRNLRDRMTPADRVKPPQHVKHWISLVGGTQPSSGLDRTALRRHLLLP